VIRGEDHISNTQRQILLQEAFGFPRPLYGHLPLVLNPDRSKLSKRHADVAALDYRAEGYLPQALINYLVLLGWHPKGDQEVFTTGELINEFDIGRVQKAGAIWSDEKLNWLNREHIKRLTTDELDEALAPFWDQKAKAAPPEFRREVLVAVRERLTTLKEINDFTGLFFELPAHAPEVLVWKKGSPAEAKEVLERLEEIFLNLAVFDAESLPQELRPLEEKYGKGNVLWPLRAALSGQAASPDPYIIASVLGKHEVLERLRAARKKLESVSS
jgi:glutamyl/glutaminyl-tRNA synthetase